MNETFKIRDLAELFGVSEEKLSRVIGRFAAVRSDGLCSTGEFLFSLAAHETPRTKKKTRFEYNLDPVIAKLAAVDITVQSRSGRGGLTLSATTRQGNPVTVIVRFAHTIRENTNQYGFTLRYLEPNQSVWYLLVGAATDKMLLIESTAIHSKNKKTVGLSFHPTKSHKFDIHNQISKLESI